MQVAQLAVRSAPRIVVDAVRRIGILLDLREEDAAPDGMERARRNHDGIARLHLDAAHDVQEHVLLDAAAALLSRDLLLETVDDLRPRLSIEDVPHLHLAVLALVLEGVAVVGMHLHREIVVRVDELDQKREIRIARTVRAERSVRPFARDVRFQRQTRIRAVLDDALILLVARKLPALRDLRERRLSAVLRLEARAAPEVVLERRSKLHRVYHSIHPFSRACIPAVRMLRYMHDNEIFTSQQQTLALLTESSKRGLSWTKNSSASSTYSPTSLRPFSRATSPISEDVSPTRYAMPSFASILSSWRRCSPS